MFLASLLSSINQAINHFNYLQSIVAELRCPSLNLWLCWQTKAVGTAWLKAGGHVNRCTAHVCSRGCCNFHALAWGGFCTAFHAAFHRNTWWLLPPDLGCGLHHSKRLPWRSGLECGVSLSYYYNQRRRFDGGPGYAAATKVSIKRDMTMKHLSLMIVMEECGRTRHWRWGRFQTRPRVLVRGGPRCQGLASRRMRHS